MNRFNKLNDENINCFKLYGLDVSQEIRCISLVSKSIMKNKFLST